MSKTTLANIDDLVPFRKNGRRLSAAGKFADEVIALPKGKAALMPAELTLITVRTSIYYRGYAPHIFKSKEGVFIWAEKRD